MKLAAVSDLHWPESKADLAALAAEAREAGADVIVLAGDAVSQFHPERLATVFTVLREAAPVRIYVPGNHELWRLEGSTAAIYERHLPALAQEHGWAYLDAAPVVVGDVAFAGNIGWYDYTQVDRSGFADWGLAFGMHMFAAARRKPCPTVPVAEVTDEQLSHKSAILVPPPALAEQGMRPALMRWNDGRYVRLGVSDRAFTDDCIARLRAHLHEAANRAERIVAVTHMVPFGRMMPPAQNPVDAVIRAYQGSDRLGEIILEQRKVTLALCGHRHRPGAHRVEHLEAINITARPDRGGRLVLRDV